MINKIGSRSLLLSTLAGVLLCPLTLLAQHGAPAARIVEPIDESHLVALSGNIHPAANARNDRGLVSPTFAMPDLTLVLSRSAEQQAAFEAFIQGQYATGSPNFHQWLTPSQIGAQYGPAQADIAAITGWLTSHGFTVNRITPDGMTIHFGGTAGQVRSAFHTEIHSLDVNGVTHYANLSDPQIPAALAPVIVGIKALHNFLPQPQHKLASKVQFNQQAQKWQRLADTTTNSQLVAPTGLSDAIDSGAKPSFGAHPLYGINGNCGTGCNYLEEDVAPYDFATIYNVLPLWNNSINGSGQTVAIAGTSLICLSTTAPCTQNDVAAFRSEFGLPAGLTPNQIDAGSYFSTGSTASVCTSTSSSATCGLGDLAENSLDVEWSGAVAPSAQIDLVVTGQSSACNTNTGAGCIDTLYDSAAYIVDNVTAKIMSLSYGQCELGNGTAGNVAYYDLWQQAAAEGISVFVSTGDSGSSVCDDQLDTQYGNPYLVQYGLSVNGIASSPYDTAVGGTDFSWCQPYVTVTGTGNNATLAVSGCAATSTSQGSPAYWATSTSGTTGASALNYVPEIPWNDSCLNPINARYIETYLSASGFDSFYGVNPATPEEACNAIYSDTIASYGGYPGWYLFYEGTQDLSLPFFVDAIGGSGGASGCVVNSTDPNGSSFGTCTSGSTTTGSSNGNIALVNDGWGKPAWQSGIAGIPADGVRDLPDVSFFAGNGNLDSATLICVSLLGSCALSTTSENTAQEVGGTSVATPQMAGVMALINQKAGAPQGLADPELYDLAGRQTYSSCSAESTTNSSTCFFQDIDNGPTAPSGPAYNTAQTISMPCNLSGTYEGGVTGSAGAAQSFGPFPGVASPNCYAFNSGDVLGTLGVSSTTAGFNSGAGFDLATGLGSLNVANVVNAWPSGAPSATFSLSASSVSIVPGATSGNTSTISVAPVDGFTGAVNLSCSVTSTPPSATSPVTCGTLASASISTSAAATSTMTVSSTGTTTTGQYVITITGTSGSITQTTTATVTVTAAPPTFSLSKSANISVSPGASTGNTATITVTPGTGGFSGTVNLTCSFTSNASNDPASCSLSPTSVILNGATAQTSTLTIGTTAATADLVRPVLPGGDKKSWLGAGGGAVLAVLLLFGIPSRRRSWRSMLAVLIALLTLGALSSCGGGGGGTTGGGGSNPGTTAGTYSVTITGTSTSPSYSANTTVTVTVQ